MLFSKFQSLSAISDAFQQFPMPFGNFQSLSAIDEDDDSGMRPESTKESTETTRK
jgi:hypothetical protein